MSPQDAVTVFTAVDGKSINKYAKREPDGSVKKGYIQHKQNYHAETRAVPDLASFAELLKDVGERPDQSIGLFVFADPPPTWQSWSRGRLARALGCSKEDRAPLAGWHDFGDGPVAARLSENLERSSWGLFDRDDAPGMPAPLRELTFGEWCEAVDLLVPGFAACGKVILPSTTTRILADGQPLNSISCHVYTQMVDVDCFAEPWHDSYERSAITSYEPAPWLDEAPVLLGFGKPRYCRTTGAMLGKQLWSIYDQSTWAVNRLVFDGKPTSYSNDLTVAPPMVQVVEGGRLDWSKIKSISRSEQKEIDAATREITGNVRTRERTYSIGRSGKQVVSGVKYVVPILTMGLEVEKSETGEKTTVGKIHESGAEHVRIRSPFRASVSGDAAYYGVHRDGSPFLYDVGTNEKYVLDRDLIEKSMWEVILDWLCEKYRPERQYPDGTVFCARLERTISMREVQIDHVIIDRLAMARDAPCYAKGGGVKRLSLPTEFHKWLQVAWGQLRNDLPSGADDFKRQIEALLKHMTFGEGAICAAWPGKRALGTWVHWMATRDLGKWARFGSYDIRGIIDKEVFRIGIKPSLAAQVSKTAHPEIAAMSQAQLTKRAGQFGIRDNKENIIGEAEDRGRWCVLSAEFIESLELATDHNLNPTVNMSDEQREEIQKSQGKGIFKEKIH